ncbi:MAG: rhodanese-like domain-containing protein [Nanoarchaeota archaeon]
MTGQVTAQELKALLSKNEMLLIDVRTPGEYGSWRINEGINIPVDTLEDSIRSIPKDKQVITICAHGIRSKAAAEFMRSKGYSAKSVLGGMAAWNSVYDTASVDISTNDARVVQVRRLGKGCIGYFVISKGEAAVIDPTAHLQEYINMAAKLNCRITKVFDTHQHADHVSGARTLANLAGAKVFLNPLDAYKFSGFQQIMDNDKILIGDAEIEALHTPGHTKGSTSFLINNVLITGDTLFVDGVARPDLRDKSEEFAEDLFNTYHNKILSMNDSTNILPGHFDTGSRIEFGTPLTSQLGTVRKGLIVFDYSKSEFIRSFRNVPPKPPNPFPLR